MRVTTLLIPEHCIKGLDYLVAKRLYPNRSEAIRVAIRDLLTTHDLFHIEALTEMAEAEKRIEVTRGRA